MLFVQENDINREPHKKTMHAVARCNPQSCIPIQRLDPHQPAEPGHKGMGGLKVLKYGFARPLVDYFTHITSYLPTDFLLYFLQESLFPLDT